jgi:hypothetical protein
MILVKLIEKLPDLIVNIVGVAMGALLAYIVARWQINRQGKDKIHDEEQLLRIKYERLCIELRDNKNTVNQFSEALGIIGKHANSLEWEWLKSIVNALSTEYYKDLLRSGLNRRLEQTIDKEIFSSYTMIDGLYHMVHQSAKYNIALLSMSNPPVEITLPISNVATYTNTVLEHLKYSVKALYDYKDSNKFIK